MYVEKIALSASFATCFCQDHHLYNYFAISLISTSNLLHIFHHLFTNTLLAQSTEKVTIISQRETNRAAAVDQYGIPKKNCGVPAVIYHDEQCGGGSGGIGAAAPPEWRRKRRWVRAVKFQRPLGARIGCAFCHALKQRSHICCARLCKMPTRKNVCSP
jgi:hypothetical protein